MSPEQPIDPAAEAAADQTPPPQEDAVVTAGPAMLQLALVVVIVSALSIGIVSLLLRLDPAGPWRLMPVYALVVALESVLTRRWLEWPERKRQHQLYTLAELLVLLTLAPLFLWLASGEVPVPASPVELLENPLAAFNLPLVLYMLLAIFVWYRAHGWAVMFINLSVTADEIRFYGSTPSQRSTDWSIAVPFKFRTSVLKRFVQGWIGGGVFLIMVAALVSFDLSDLSATLSDSPNLRTVTRLGLAQETLLALLVYFLGGLWLISHGRAVVQEGRWLADGSRQDPRVLSRWRTWAPLLIIGLAALALFLPIGSTYPLFQALQALARLFLDIMSAILAVISLLIYFITSLLPASEAIPDLPRPDPGSLVDQAPLPAEQTSNIPALFAGSTFWLALIALTIVATLYFLGERGPSVNLARLDGLWRRVLAWLRALGRGAAGTVTSLARPIRWPLRRPSLDMAGRSPFRYLRIGALPPREQIRFLYLSLVRHAGKQGLPRSPDATPIEFTQGLKAEWPDAEADLDLLTGAFLVARYAADDIDENRLREARAAWLHIRRRKRSQPQSGE